MIRIYERSLCQSYAGAYRAGIKIGEAETREDALKQVEAMTPPCTQCVHSCFKAFNSVTILCDSGAYLDHVERTCCERYDNFVAIDVRGTRWCRFEQKPPKAEDGDES